MGVDEQSEAPAILTLGKGHGTHFTGSLKLYFRNDTSTCNIIYCIKYQSFQILLLLVFLILFPLHKTFGLLGNVYVRVWVSVCVLVCISMLRTIKFSGKHSTYIHIFKYKDVYMYLIYMYMCFIYI
jgi:hypothetical protein